MNRTKVKDMKSWRNLYRVAGLAVLAGSVAAIALAQDFRQERSNGERWSYGTQQATTVVPRTTWDNAGRAFLRWWDPLFELGNEIDNDTPFTTVPTGAWNDPILPVTYFTELASGYFQAILTNPPYRFATLVTTNTFNNQTGGATAVYQWNINGLVPNQDYELYVNIPIGPTAIPDGAAPNTRYLFGQRYYVYNIIDDNPLTPVEDIVDSSFAGGGYAPLGNGGNISTVRYRANALGVISIQLYNTVPRAAQGGFMDPLASPNDETVYADAVKAVASTPTRAGTYSASPIVGQLLNLPAGGPGAAPFDQRVVSARNENLIVDGNEYNLGVLTSFIHNGALAVGGQPERRNMVWSWPARRPFDISTAEDDRYAADRAAWINGGAASNPRTTVRRVYDNLQSGVIASGPFVSANVAPFTGFNGPDYLLSPVELVAATGGVLFNGDGLRDGDYTIQAWLPTGDTPADLARGVQYEILVNGVVVDTIIVDQSVGNGWITLPDQPADGWTVDDLNTLAVRVTNRSINANDAGRQVFADAVRFVAKSDLRFTSTPVMVSANVQVGATVLSRDVVIAAAEDGRVYCIDAHGDTPTGVPPTVYWSYPSEDPTADPNNDAAQDGVGNIASAPFGQAKVAPLFVNTAAGPMVYIATQTGKVICLEVTGRGDGSTRRRWTWPDDYNPSTPLAPFAPTPGAPVASPVFVNSGPNGRIVVPYSAVTVALDAVGNDVTRTTTLDWFTLMNGNALSSIPGSTNLLAIETQPAPTLNVIDGNTGLLIAPGPMALTGGTYRSEIAPLYLPAAISGLAEDLIYTVSDSGRVTCLRAADFTTVWFADEALGGAAGTPAFTFLRTYDTSPLPGPFLVDAVPSIVMATRTGQMMGFYADGTVNASGTRRNWRYQLEGDQQEAGIAVGGWPNLPVAPANRTHIYTGDNEGFFYAFSSEDDDDLVPPLTPGRRPGFPQAGDNNPTQSELNGIITSDNVILLSPAIYNDLFTRAQAGTLDYADVQAAALTAIQRRDFEFGETLYLMIWNIHDPAQPPVGAYTVEVQVTGGASGTGRPTMRRMQTVRTVLNAPAVEDAGIVLVNVALNPTGSGGLVPGQNGLTVSAVANGVRGVPVALNSSAQTLALPDFRIANPLGVRFPSSDLANAIGVSSAGITTDATQLIVRGNRPAGIDPTVAGGPTPWRFKSGGFGGALVDEPGGYFGTSMTASGDAVPHSASGQSRMQVVDRSLMRLLLGNEKGLQNVRLSPGDLEWQPNSDPTLWPTDASDPTLPRVVDPATDLGVYKPLNTGSNKAAWLYRNFEDYPWQTPNRSLDYPDVNRNSLVATKSAFGNVENPLFNGIQLSPPSFTTSDLNTYRTPAGYENQLTRALQSTDMDLMLNVARYQPTNLTSYRGRQYVYVDAGSPGYQDTDTSRYFALGLRVALDERMSTGTPTIDLGSQPSGGGFNGFNATPGLAEYPWVNNSLFRPWITNYNSGQQKMFESFTVLNDGNVNMLNVRMSKAFDRQQGFATRVERPMELFAAGLHELAWLDAAFSLYSDLDPQFSAVLRAGLATDRNILQKPRPGDVSSTRMSTNPGFRANANLRTQSGFLLNIANFPPGDPRVGVATPIGTPVGDFTRKIFAFEDILELRNNVNAPALGPRALGVGTDPNNTEPYTDPGITLKFTVRESRLTNRPTAKSAPNVEDLPIGNANYQWSNRQPTMMRGPQGEIYAAFASNRQTAANISGFIPRLRTDVDMAGQDIWRIYVTAMGGTTFAGANALGQSPIRDLNGFVADPTRRWFTHLTEVPGPGFPLATLFAPALNAGEVLDTSQGAASARFHSPAYPSNSFSNPLDLPNNTGPRTTNELNGTPYLAFIGEATKTDQAGTQTKINMLCMAEIASDGTINRISTMPFDMLSTKTKPGVVQVGDDAIVYYTGTTGGNGDIFWTRYSNGVWQAPRPLGIGNMFENLGTPSVVAKSARLQGTDYFNHVLITAKLRGRQTADAFMMRMRINGNGLPNGRDPIMPFTRSFDQLEIDASAGQFWTPGLRWRLNDADLNAFDIRRVPGNAASTILDLASRDVDRATGVITYNSTLGGKVIVDAARGSIRFTGAVIPRNMSLYAVNYFPTILRVSTGAAANYRNGSMIFDDRFIGIFVDPSNPERNLTNDLNYWRTGGNGAVTASDPIRQDRFVMVFNRTSGDGSAAVRPYLRTMRYGIQLPTPIAMDRNGVVINLTISGVGASADPLFYQVDPASGRVYFSQRYEDQSVTVTYTGVDGNGNQLPAQAVTAVVSLITERNEEALPIEQVGNESDVFIAREPIGDAWNAAGYRRPNLYWLMWTSTRAGTQDVFFQTIAPRFAPQPPTP